MTREQIKPEYLSILDRYRVTEQFIANCDKTPLPIEATSFLQYMLIHMGKLFTTNEGAFFWYAVATENEERVNKYKKIEELKKIDKELGDAIKFYYITKDMQATLKLHQKCVGDADEKRILHFKEAQDQYELVIKKFVASGKLTYPEFELITYS